MVYCTYGPLIRRNNQIAKSKRNLAAFTNFHFASYLRLSFMKYLHISEKKGKWYIDSIFIHLSSNYFQEKKRVLIVSGKTIINQI